MPDVFALTDLASIKTLLEIDGESRDAEIALHIRSVSGQIAQFCGRNDAFEERARTEVYDVAPGQRVWQLRAYPVTSITDVRLDWNREFGTGTILDANTYTVRNAAGLLTMDYPLVSVASRRWAQILQVIYTGGLAARLSALRSGYPDIEMAAQYQIQHNMKRRETDPGQFSVNVGGASRTTPALDLLEYVQRLLAPYVCHRIGNS